MPRDPEHRFARDQRDTSELVRVALTADDEQTSWDAVMILHYRGSATELAVAQDLAKAPDPKRRELAADILGQLGWDERTFLSESVDTLILLLGDSTPSVAAHAATALGHRRDPRAIPHLLKQITNAAAEIRLGVVHGLSCHDDVEAVQALMILSSDGDRDVRNWATFGLGSLTGLDTPGLRDTLIARTSDDDAEIRGEALLGLARRHDLRALDLLRAELQRPFEGDWSLEAAELFAEPSLYPLLKEIWDSLEPEDRNTFRRTFDAALEACKPKHAV